MKLNIAIIGYGRFGKLFAQMLSAEASVFVLEKNEKIVPRIPYKQIALKDIAQMDWVVFCVPISAMEDAISEIAPFLNEDTIVMDTCSVKEYPCKILKKHCQQSVHIIGTHPMFGPDSAKITKHHKQIVLCPVRIGARQIAQITKVFSNIKLDIITTTPTDHDKKAAWNLALVHFIGRGLIGSGIIKHDITTYGYDELLKISENIGRDTDQLFLDIQKYNPYAANLRKKFMAQLNELENSIEDFAEIT